MRDLRRPPLVGPTTAMLAAPDPDRRRSREQQQRHVLQAAGVVGVVVAVLIVLLAVNTDGQLGTTVRDQEPAAVFDLGDSVTLFEGPVEQVGEDLVVVGRASTTYPIGTHAYLPVGDGVAHHLADRGTCRVVDGNTFRTTITEGDVVWLHGVDGAFDLGDSDPVTISGAAIVHDGCRDGQPLEVQPRG